MTTGLVSPEPVPPVCVVIPTWNGARFLAPCLSSLRRQTYEHFAVIVVDNGSTDNTREVLAAFPEVRVLGRVANAGFAVAVNEGIRASTSALVVLLNNDTEAEPGWLQALVGAMEAYPDAGMATSKLKLFDERDRLHTTGDTVSLAGWPANRGVWERDTGQWDKATAVFGASGAAGAYRRAVFEDVGCFEERFGSYMEDVDLAWRAQLAGWRCVFVPTAVVYHHLSATGGGPLASYLVARNRVWLLARNYPWTLLRKHIGRVIAAQTAEAWRALRAWRGAEARATLRGLAVGWLTWPRMLPARRRIQQRRRITDEEMERLLTVR